MRHLLATPLIAMLLLSTPSHADAAAGLEPGTLAVGRTGIYCSRAPCPWRGIVGPVEGLRPLWTDAALPALQAAPTDRERIIQAWEAFECVLVQGEFDGKTLAVSKVLGPC